jgi:putative ABC transport system substrate-binding protein
MISRRGFLGASAFAVTLALPAVAQPAPRRLAWLTPTTVKDGEIFLTELKTGLKELGYVDGQNLVIEPYYGEDSADKLAALVPQAIAAKPDIIVAMGGAALATKQANSPIPIVFGYSGDPIEAGLVESLGKPGRNTTGISYMTLELVGKRMELVKEVLPKAGKVAVIANPQHPGDQAERRSSEAAAAKLGLEVKYFEARNIPQQMAALAEIEKAPLDAVMLFPVQTVISNRENIAKWSVQNRIPTVSGWAQFADGGNLMSYGPNLLAASRRLAAFVDGILKGAKASDLPVELPSRIEFVMNLRTAKALGIPVSPSVLVRADRVIE